MRRLVLCLALVASKPVIAGRTIIEAEGAVNLGVTQQTQSKIDPDPNPEPGDVSSSWVTRPFLELRPAIGFARGSERLYWRANYQFAGILSLDDTGGLTYTNQASLALIALLTKATSLSLEGSIAQGGTQFLLGQRDANAGTPELQAPGNPSVVLATISESLQSELTRELQLQQGLQAQAHAPQNDLSARSTSLVGMLGLHRVFQRDQIGIVLRAGVSQLKPLQLNKPAYLVQTNALVARWARDLSRQLSGAAELGVEQVYIHEGARPVAVLPTGNASAIYSWGTKVGSIEASHAAHMNLQLGTATATTRLGARGSIVFDPVKLRTLNFSAGILHNEPLAESAPLLAAGTGNAVQGDVGFTTELTKTVIATARYSLTYQFDQVAGIPARFVHIAIVGVTARYSNTEQLRARQKPKLGRRVDSSDGVSLDGGPAPSGRGP